MRSESVFANPSFRRHLVGVTGGFTAALLALAAAVVFVPLFQRFDAGAASAEQMLRLTGEILEVHARYWPVAALAWLATLACSWALYARMRGPLVRFVAVFRALAAGRLPEDVVIRATDYVQDECAELNAMLAALRARSGERAAALQRSAELAAELAERADASGDARLAACVDALEAELKTLREPGEGGA
jgi:methyl-accepting chemotaxis protein